MFECLRAGADEAAQPTGRLPHQVHGPTICSKGKEHVITHILVHVHLGLGEGKADRQAHTCESELLKNNSNNAFRNRDHLDPEILLHINTQLQKKNKAQYHCFTIV